MMHSIWLLCIMDRKSVLAFFFFFSVVWWTKGKDFGAFVTKNTRKDLKLLSKDN